MRRLFISILTAILIVTGADARTPKVWRKLKQNVNFFVASDLDKGGCYDQKVIAELMGTMAATIKPECIISTGDTHHGNGVESATDPDWKSNFEDIYNHPKLQIDWMAAIGNHEYRGEPQALIDYSKVNPHWKMPARYYTKVFKKSGVSIRFVVIDTTPLIERYRNSEKYSDAGVQDNEQQLQWLESVLTSAKEDWVVVLGHHPIHADTKKSKQERTDMRNSVDTILRNYDNVDIYLCGHIHTFQHLRDKNSHIDYVVNSSASQGRSVRSTKRTIYCSPDAGFSVLSVGEKTLQLHMIDKNGNILHTVKRTK